MPILCTHLSKALVTPLPSKSPDLAASCQSLIEVHSLSTGPCCALLQAVLRSQKLDLQLLSRSPAARCQLMEIASQTAAMPMFTPKVPMPCQAGTAVRIYQMHTLNFWLPLVAACASTVLSCLCPGLTRCSALERSMPVCRGTAAALQAAHGAMPCSHVPRASEPSPTQMRGRATQDQLLSRVWFAPPLQGPALPMLLTLLPALAGLKVRERACCTAQKGTQLTFTSAACWCIQ